MKKLLILLVLLIVAGVAAFLLDNPLGKLVKLTVEEFGPKITRAQVRVDKVVISATDGHGTISGLLLGNPAGYNTDYALKADTIEIAMEPASVAHNVVVIHRILIDAPHIIYEKGDEGANFDVIQRNVEQYLGASGGRNGEPANDAGKKLIIDSFIIRNARVNFNGLVDITLPDIELHNLGKNTGGVTSAQVVKVLITELNIKLVRALAKAAAGSAAGGVAVGAELLKNFLGK